MPPPEADRTLRRLVARLAELKDADRQAILRSLSREQAQEVARLIGAYRGDAVVQVAGATDGPWAGLGLSLALRHVLEGDDAGLRMPAAAGDGGERHGAPTAMTLETLRRLARDLEPVLPEQSARSPEPQPGLWSRLLSPGRRR